MKWNKILSAVSVCALTASLLAGCGSSSDSDSGGTDAVGTSDGGSKKVANGELNIAVFQGGYGREYWDQVSDEFMKEHPGTKINITASPKIAELVRPKIVAGNPPDLMYIAGGDNLPILDGLIKDKALTDLSDIFNTDDGSGALKDKMLPGVLESRSMAPYGDGKIYLAPFNFGVLGLWYNKTLFDQKNIQTPKTWDELFAMNATAKDNGRALFTYQGLYPGYLDEVIIPSIYDLGGQKALDQFFDYDPEFWKGDVFKQVWGNIQKFANEDNGLMKGTVALNHTQAQTSFMQGKAMFIPNGTWFEDEMKDAPREDGFQFGFLGIPSFKSGSSVKAMSQIEQIVIPAKAKNPELAAEFLKYIYSDKSIKLNAEKSKAVMAVKDAADLAKPYISETTYNVYKAVDNGMELVNGAFKTVAKGSRYSPKDEVYKTISSLMNKQMTLDEYSDKMYKMYTEVSKELKDSAE
ncbi:carbohydrate ABC transporter substrate-binding protein [Paenibacillus sp. HJL G12]|uniref:Carbohydrate ABC transporter substrate-binding protein n=1 Tax=Paenibacillus dendrobii TaxID=2691084 RepID=A0A7X3IKI1_9BACL|nr:carbohydrate ABC transporter substrate-binding protein [Paenibacillus dendrobii]MWV43712.1 carbohydrate ABC transporter substrate-binding protein [Paenibacillus dendrobii]